MLGRLILPAVVAVLSLSACKQDDDWQPPQPPPPDAPASAFGISGDTAVQVMRARGANASLLLSDSGAGHAIHLGISGLPPGVTAEIDPPTGTPNFYTTVRFNASVYAVASSSSTATVVATSADGEEKTHSIRVTVLENPDCVEVVSGEYRGWGGSGGGYPATITADPALPNTRIRIDGFFFPGYIGYADLNCSNGTVVFPLQSFTSGNVISGSGTFTHDTIQAAMTHVYDEPGPTGPTGQTITRHFPMVFSRR